VGAPGAARRRCIKYVQRYGAEVHAAWGAAGLAPALLECRRLPGGWLEVEMEMLEVEDGWEMLAACSEAVRDELLPAVHNTLLAAHGLPIRGAQLRGAHGDVRGANVFVRRRVGSGEAEVRFVDFDWAGVQGEVAYPPMMNSAIQWPEGARPGGFIRQEHDLQLLLSRQR
jgi:hypothetical protein